MKQFQSIRHKLMAMVLLTTFFGVVVAGFIFLLYDVNSYRSSRINDMATQIELLAYSTATALQFGDESVGRDNLELLRIRESVEGAAIYDAQGELFATYVRPGLQVEFPPVPESEGILTADGKLLIFIRIIQNGEFLGTAYMQTEYLMLDRVLRFVGILTLVTAGAMAIATLLSLWLQSGITGPILSVAAIARRVVSDRIYSRRAEKFTNDEVGILVDDFNDMLQEIEKRTTALEQINSELEEEIEQRKEARNEILRLNEELRHKIDQLNEADRHKDDFLATLAHELRNPLAPIRSGLEMLRRVEGGRREEIYQILERQTNQLIHLVDELMDVSRISRGKVKLHKKPVLLADIIQGAVEATHNLMEQKKHALTVSLPEEPVELYADPVRLTQVFLNLLSNAAHYTPAEGRIALSASSTHDELEVRIRDNGIGMSTEMLEKVFEAFIQVENPLSRDRSQSGLGIGLTLSKALIEMHGGTIRAESAGENLGTEFIVRLPVDKGEAPAATEPLCQDEPETGQCRILVVDDNEDAARTLAMLLRLKGHEVQVVFSGLQALAAGPQFLPRIVLMDLGMPEMNGIEAAREIRKTAWGEHVKLVAITGWGQEDDKRGTREAGFDHHLVKPVEAKDLLQLLDKLESARRL